MTKINENHRAKDGNVYGLTLPLILLLISLLVFSACQVKDKNEVVIYTSLDQIFSEPILKKFEYETSIRVKALYDTEATKTVGLANRLIAEKDNPKADVFWNSEIVRTIILKRMGVLSPYNSANARSVPGFFKDPNGYWTGFGARARVIIINRDLIKSDEYPKSIRDLTNRRWKGVGALSLPLFGTANTHALALFQLWGVEKTKEFFSQCVDNKVQVLDGNSVVRDRVADGLLKFGLTDTDDAYLGILRGKHVDMIYPDQDSFGTLLIPNTVALIAGAPRLENAKKLIDYLLSEKVEETLAFSDSMQIPLRPHVRRPSHCPSLKELRIMDVDYKSIGEKADEYSMILRKIFMKQ
jgi:iron(III) transport system substrate-binding protein